MEFVDKVGLMQVILECIEKGAEINSGDSKENEICIRLRDNRVKILNFDSQHGNSDNLQTQTYAATSRRLYSSLKLGINNN